MTGEGADDGSRRSARLVFAAGGLVWQQTPGGPLVAVVHRPRYDDWVLPKGKLDPGEKFPDAALREVREETGCEARLGEFAGVDSYRIERGIKVVLYWHMTLAVDPGFVPGPETDAIDWLPPADALRRLAHAGERRLLKDR